VKAFVSGGSGFVGRSLIAALAARGDEVMALARSAAAAATVEALGARVVRGDLDDVAVLRSGMSGCQCAFHSAALVDQWGDPGQFERVNVQGTANMLEAAREAFVAQINHIRARLLSGTILQSDETGLRVGKRNWWLWVFHHDDSAIFVIEPSRGKCVVEGFLARSALISGSRTATAARWAGRKKTIRSAARISFATCNMPSTPATAFSHPVCTICLVEPAGLAGGETSSRT
jgi:hypothetical protein